jgi:hypothetical protein
LTKEIALNTKLTTKPLALDEGEQISGYPIMVSAPARLGKTEL